MTWAQHTISRLEATSMMYSQRTLVTSRREVVIVLVRGSDLWRDVASTGVANVLVRRHLPFLEATSNPWGRAPTDSLLAWSRRVEYSLSHDETP